MVTWVTLVTWSLARIEVRIVLEILLRFEVKYLKGIEVTEVRELHKEVRLEDLNLRFQNLMKFSGFKISLVWIFI